MKTTAIFLAAGLWITTRNTIFCKMREKTLKIQRSLSNIFGWISQELRQEGWCQLYAQAPFKENSGTKICSYFSNCFPRWGHLRLSCTGCVGGQNIHGRNYWQWISIYIQLHHEAFITHQSDTISMQTGLTLTFLYAPSAKLGTHLLSFI